MADEGFRLPGSSYPEIVKIVRGYNAQKDATGPDEIAKTISVHPTIVSRNNAFLVSVGILDGGNKKALTSAGRALGAALDYEMPEHISKEWKSIVLRNDFLDRLIAAVRIRKGMEYGTFQTHIAYSAGRPKSQSVMTGAATVIEILRASGLLKDDEGKLVAVQTDNVEPGEAGDENSTFTPTAIGGARDISGPVVIPATSMNSGGVSIQIQIQVGPNDLDKLGAQIRQLLADLKEPQPQEDQ